MSKMKIERFEDVLAWQKARLLGNEIFKEFGTLRNYGFRDQILRACLSVTNNIAEGFERGGQRELRQFLIIARGSNAEVRSMLYIAKDNNYIGHEKFTELMELANRVGRLLTGFIKSIQPSNHPTIGSKR